MAQRKSKLVVNPRTRAVEKRPIPPKIEDELPKPEPIKLAAGIKPTNGEAAQVPPAPGVAGGVGVKLDLACGQSPREGYEGVDLYAPNAKHKVDLFRFPYPWADNSVDEIYCSHFIEHLPAREVEERDLQNHASDGVRQRFIGQDFLFAFFDECYRVLKPDSWMHVICPSVRSERAFQDPTHRRFIAQATFYYLWRDWRVSQKLDHYNVKCNFVGNVNFSFPIELQGRAEEVTRGLYANAWNVILDYIADLKAVK
jgi:hypothetical protein